MRTFFLLLLICGLGYVGYLYWPKPEVLVVSPPSTPEPTVRAPRLAPPGTYFLIDYVSVPTAHGMVGWIPGQEVHQVPLEESDAGKRWMTDGTLQAQVPLSLLTRDIDLAARLADADASSQEKAAVQGQIQYEEHQRELVHENMAHAKTVHDLEKTRNAYEARHIPTALDDRH